MTVVLASAETNCHSIVAMDNGIRRQRLRLSWAEGAVKPSQNATLRYQADT